MQVRRPGPPTTLGRAASQAFRRPAFCSYGMGIAMFYSSSRRRVGRQRVDLNRVRLLPPWGLERASSNERNGFGR